MAVTAMAAAAVMIKTLSMEQSLLCKGRTREAPHLKGSSGIWFDKNGGLVPSSWSVVRSKKRRILVKWGLIIASSGYGLGATDYGLRDYAASTVPKLWPDCASSRWRPPALRVRHLAVGRRGSGARRGRAC